MARIGKADVHQALERAAQQIAEAGGKDGRVSRADIKDHLGKLEGTEKALVDILYRFIDHRDHRPGAQITKADINKALEYAKDKLIDDYDLNNNGLSKSEIAEMSTTGQLAVDLAKELKAAGPQSPVQGPGDTDRPASQSPLASKTTEERIALIGGYEVGINESGVFDVSLADYLASQGLSANAGRLETAKREFFTEMAEYLTRACAENIEYIAEDDPAVADVLRGLTVTTDMILNNEDPVSDLIYAIDVGIERDVQIAEITDDDGNHVATTFRWAMSHDMERAERCVVFDRIEGELTGERHFGFMNTAVNLYDT